MDILLTQIGKRLFERRKQLRFTQEELSEIAGITPQTISYAELGKKALRPENIIKVCSALKISTDYLLLGVITDRDVSILDQDISILRPEQYRYLEDIIHSYISAVSTVSTEKATEKGIEV